MTARREVEVQSCEAADCDHRTSEEAGGWVMGGEALAGSSAGERLALSGETFEQRCRRPLRTGARLQLPQTADDLVEPDAIGVVHRAAAVGGPVVTIDPDDVDV